MDKAKWLKRGGWAVYSLWHVIFAIIALTMLLPFLAFPLINSARHGAAPWSYAIYTSLIVGLPFMTMVVVNKRFKDHIAVALRLFYAVELPLMLLIILRVTLFRDASFAAQFLFLNIIVGIAAYLAMLLVGPKFNSALGDKLSLGLSALVALVGLYLGLLLGLFLLPAGLMFLGEIGSVLWNLNWSAFTSFLDDFIFNLLLPFYMLLFSTFVFFLITPLILIVVYVHQFVRRCRASSRSMIISVVLILLSGETLVFSLSYKQPQQPVFVLTQSLPTDALNQNKLLAESETIREGLLSAYLAAYRYVSTTGKSHALIRSYSKLLGTQSAIPALAQTLFNGLAFPFLYQGDSFDDDKALAADRYQQFFDTPIEKAEREAVIDAVKATWESGQNEAGLMDAANHHVFLTQQQIKVEAQGDIARITLTQTLVNQTFQTQEALFHFELPEDAVVTGLWMSDDVKNPEKFSHIVSPRGAAQSVYKSEMHRRVDPALLEKVGPVQYRLRAFPIPARQIKYKPKFNFYLNPFPDFGVKPAIVQFQYVVARDAKGRWPMPVLLEKRNVFWNEKTKRSHQVKSELDWLPESIVSTMPVKRKTHVATVNNVEVKAVPRDDRSPDAVLSGSIAIIVDGSYSMNQVQKRLQDQLAWLTKNKVNYDLFFCQAVCEKSSIQLLKDKVYFGNSQLLQQLSQWATHETVQYSAVFVLTDAGSYELSPDKKTAFNLPSLPLWLIHLSKQLPYAYEDAVMETVNQRGGGVARTLDAGIKQFLWSKQLGQTVDKQTLIGVSPDYFWYRLDAVTHEPVADSRSYFAALAANRWIQSLAANSDTSQLAQLDKIHAIAKEFDITSFYSSMLVLVNDRQKKRLKEAESRENRFDREVETGEELLSKPTDPFAVPAVPEPEEWALLLVVICLLSGAAIRRYKY